MATDPEAASLDRLEMDQLLARWTAIGAANGRTRSSHCRASRTFTIGPSAKTPGPAATRRWRWLRGSATSTASRRRAAWRITGASRRVARTRANPNERLGSITKEGSTLARYLLGQLVLHVLKQDAAMRQWYQRIKQRRGSKIARVAVMRRLTVIFWHMLTKQQPYVLSVPAAQKLKPRRRAKAAPKPAAASP